MKANEALKLHAEQPKDVDLNRLRLLIFVVGMVCVLLPVCATNAREPHPALQKIEGTWWSSCDAPAAEFSVQGDRYSGDFTGSHRLDLDGGVLTFHDGLVGANADGAIGKPTAFRIIAATGKRLVLRATAQSEVDDDWHLRTCEPYDAR